MKNKNQNGQRKTKNEKPKVGNEQNAMGGGANRFSKCLTKRPRDLPKGSHNLENCFKYICLNIGFDN